MTAFHLLLANGFLTLMNLRRLAERQSRLKVYFISGVSVFMFVGLFFFFKEGFYFLSRLGGVGTLLVDQLFPLFFGGIGCMLVVSGLASSFFCLFRSKETDYLMSAPVPPGEIVLYKFIQSGLLSSWAFFFIVIPFVGAYAIHEKLSPLFAVWTVMFSVPFLLICAGVSTLICLLFTRWLPRGRYMLVLLVVLAMLAFIWMLFQVRDVAQAADEDTFIMARLVPGLRLASYPLWPSWWVSEGIMDMVRGRWGRGMMMWAVLLGNTLMIGLILEVIGKLQFYTAWQRVRIPILTPEQKPILSDWLDSVCNFLPRQTKALITKDLRVFFRDPAQWSQGLIFFALLAFYFSNLRNLRYDVRDMLWRNLVGFLNVFSISAVMCAFGCRFVYPQLSLEGQSVWVIGLSPCGMIRAYMAKFFSALVCLILISVSLTWFSAGMLKLEPSVAMVTVGVVSAMALAISGVSTGLGAIFMDLHQRNPAAIFSSFGGTLNLIVCLVMLVLAIFPFGFLFHMRYSQAIGRLTFNSWIKLTFCWLLVISSLVSFIPLWLGYRSLLDREY